MYDIVQLGFTDFFRNYTKTVGSDLEIARVSGESKGGWSVLTAENEYHVPSGTGISALVESPIVGDFVVLSKPQNKDSAMTEDNMRRIAAILPRRTCLKRRSAGGGGHIQYIAANIDYILVVTSANAEFNERRLERYLVSIWESGALPCIVLSKIDLAKDANAYIERIQAIAPACPIFAIDGVVGTGFDRFIDFLKPGLTFVLVGSSGVGKSTILNRLLDESRQEVKEVSAFMAKGKHTTTSRSLHFLPTGAMVIDTPGMRELLPDVSGEAITAVFGNIEELALRCRFSNCHHQQEPGCAIQTAISDGNLDRKRVESWQKLERDRQRVAGLEDKKARSNAKRRFRSVSKAVRQVKGIKASLK